MKRFPLYVQILLWSFVNLVVLAAVFLGVIGMQFHLGADWILTFGAGDRIDALAEGVLGELRSSPRDQWDSVLQRFAEPYGVDLSLVAPDAHPLAGAALEVPPELRERLFQRPGGGWRPPRRGGGPGGGGPPRGGEGPGGGGPGGFAKFMAHTDRPSLYWVVVRVPLPEATGPRVGPPSMLVIKSHTLHGGGLLFDFAPWLTVAGAVFVLSALIWLPFVHGITRSLSQVTRATEQMAQGQFDVRLSTGRRDEIGVLAGAVNRMAERLSGFVTGQKRFLGDIAHELCAPIARLQMTMGILEQRADAGGGAASAVEDARQEVEEMSALVNELLSFSKAGLGVRQVECGPVEVEPVARRVVQREADEDRVRVRVPAGLRVRANPELLARALSNLVRNAVRYAGDAGPIEIAAESIGGGQVAVHVSDSGPGVPAAELSRIFDPFYRVEASRSRETGGAGLGLAIVKTCVEACQGAVHAQNRHPSGLQVTIQLPAAPQDPV